MALSWKYGRPVLVTIVGVALAWLGAVQPAQATTRYAEATGQRCGVCHVGQPGPGPLTAMGQQFAAIPAHRTDPAGVWAQVAGPSASPVPGASPAPRPAPGQVPSQLPRTGESQPSPLAPAALMAGLALMLVGGILAVRTPKRRTED